MKEFKMNLVQQIIYKYKTFELLESMIELSRVNTVRLQGIRDIQLTYGMTGFDTGRQTGKSTAIARYLKENNAIVVSPTQAHKTYMTGLLQYVDNFNLCVGDFDDSCIFRGLHGEFEFDLIFDECNLADIHLCVNRLREYAGIKIRSIVKVGL